MPFEPVDPKVNFPEVERRILGFWREADVFRRQLEQRKDGPLWVFYEGPPTANGRPALHHAESRTFKDIYPRFRAMTGHFVPRKAGWDCHGLPVELEVEREIGTKTKRDIEAFGIAEFNRLCRESVQRYVDEFERQTERLGFWIDTDDAYWTMDTEYIESVWWSLKQLHARGLLVEADRIATYCPRCGTPLSDAEVAMGYAEVEDPSVYVGFRVREAPDESLVGASLLGWTTTPWTLVSNAGLAVAPDAPYVVVERDGDRLGARRVSQGGGAAGRIPSSVGPCRAPRWSERGTSRCTRTSRAPIASSRRTSSRWRTARAIVHMAPAFGAPDLEVGIAQGWPVFKPLDGEGRFTDEAPSFVRGMFFKDADPVDHRGPALARVAAARRDDHAHLSPVLAMRHAADLHGADLLVHPHHRGEGPAPRRERGGGVVPGAHQARPVRRLAFEQRRLGALARAILGHPPADLALPEPPRHGDRIPRGALGPRGSRRDRGRPASPGDRRGHVRVPRVRPRCDAPARGDRHVVRLGSDAVRAVGLPPRARTRARSVRGALPRRFHRRGDRPDARLVLHPDGRGGPALRPDRLPQPSCASVSSWTRRAGRCRSRSGTRSTRSRSWTVRAPTRSAGTCSPADLPGPRGACRWRSSTRSSARFLLPLWNVYAFFVTYANAERLRARRTATCRSPSARCSIAGSPPGSRGRSRRATRSSTVRRHERGPPDRAVRRRPVELVRPARASAVLGPGRRRRERHAGGVLDAARLPRHARAAPRALHAVRRRGAVAEPGSGPRRQRPTPCTSRTTRSSAPRSVDRDLDGAMAQRSGDRRARAPRPDRDEDQGPSAAPGGRRPHDGAAGAARAAHGADRRGAEREARGLRGPVGAPRHVAGQAEVPGARAQARIGGSRRRRRVGGGRRVRRVGARTGRDRRSGDRIRIRAARPRATSSSSRTPSRDGGSPARAGSP